MSSKYQSVILLLVGSLAIAHVCGAQTPQEFAQGALQSGQQVAQGIQGHLSNLLTNGEKAVKTFANQENVKPYIERAQKVVAPYVEQAPGLINQAMPTIQKIRDGVSGFFGSLTSSFTGGQQNATAPVEQAVDAAQKPAEQVQQFANQTQGVASEVANQAGEMAEQAKEAAGGAVEQAKEAAGGAAEQAKEAAGGAVEQAQQVASNVVEQAQQGPSDDVVATTTVAPQAEEKAE